VYIRIARNNLPDVYKDDYKFNPLKASILQQGSDVTIVSNGDVLAESIQAANILSQKGINAEVISLPVVKPFDKETVINSARKTNFVVTVENHSVIGGIGSAVCECLSEYHPTKVLRIGINDVFGQSGKAEELVKYYGLDADSIAAKIVEVL